MGNKGKWFVAVKRVFSPNSKENKTQKSKSKKRWFGQCSNFDESELFDASPNKPIPLPQPDEVELANGEDDRSKHAYSVALASAVAVEAAAVAAQAAAEVVRLTKSARLSGRSREEVAAIKIQTAFRGYRARRALRALRGLVRLRAMTNGNSVKQQAMATLRSMQTLARVQSEIHSRRIRMTEENQALQKQLQLKHERELEKQRMTEDWDTSLQTKEQIEANLQHRQEAAIRRERAMAYAFSHQRKNFSLMNQMFMDPNNLQWGWSWLERWMATRPWEGQKDVDYSPLARTADTTKTFARRDAESSSSAPKRPPSRRSLSTPPKVKSTSPKSGRGPADDDSISNFVGVRRERTRQNSTDDASVSSAHYMSSTQSVKARSRLQALSADQSDAGSERGSVGSAKKRLSFPAASTPSPVRARRLSGPHNA